MIKWSYIHSEKSQRLRAWIKYFRSQNFAKHEKYRAREQNANFQDRKYYFLEIFGLQTSMSYS